MVFVLGPRVLSGRAGIRRVRARESADQDRGFETGERANSDNPGGRAKRTERLRERRDSQRPPARSAIHHSCRDSRRWNSGFRDERGKARVGYDRAKRISVKMSITANSTRAPIV